MQATANASCRLDSTPLLAAPLHIATFAGVIGIVPVVVVLQGQVYVDANIGATASVTTDASASASITGGISYDRGSFSPIFTGPDAKFGFDPPTVTATATAQAHIEPALQMLLYGVGGPQLGVKTGLDFSADTTQNPWWTLDAPLDIEASLVAPVLGLNSPDLTLYSHTFHITDAGGPFQAGAGSTTPPAAPTPAPPTTPTGGGVLTNATQVSAGDLQACALLSTDNIDCWGYNASGALGDGTTTGPDCEDGGCSTRPVAVSGITSASQIAAGVNQTCALLAGGSIDCWGDNSDGELGDGTTGGPDCGGGCSAVPVTASGTTNATQITAGLATCALLASGSIDCWGDNGSGELGDGTTASPDCDGHCSPTPVAVSGVTNAKQVAAGWTDACALLTTGRIDCWGDNGLGELGDGTTGGP